jgi:hypothetical protein
MMQRSRLFKTGPAARAYCCVVVKLGPAADANARQLICTPQATWFRQSTAFRSLAMECHSDANQQSADVGTRDGVCSPCGYVVLWGTSGDLPERRRLFQSLKWSYAGRALPEGLCQGSRIVQMPGVEILARSDSDKIKGKMEENELALARL